MKEVSFSNSCTPVLNNCVWCLILFYIDPLFAVPGVCTGLQGRHPYVVWNPPEEPNGVITGYRLRFTRSSTTRTVTTNNDQTYYVIQSSDIPWTSGSFSVTVSILHIQCLD